MRNHRSGSGKEVEVLGHGDLPGQQDLLNPVGGITLEEVRLLFPASSPAGRFEDFLGTEIQVSVEVLSKDEPPSRDLHVTEGHENVQVNFHDLLQED